jgi:hypothetical protein
MHNVDPNLLSVILAAVATHVGHEPPRPAYLDPGTGSLLLQAAIAGLVTVPFVLRRKLAAGLSWLRRSPSRTLESNPEKGSDTPQPR